MEQYDGWWMGLLMALAFVIGLSSQARAEDVKALCFIEDMGKGFECKMNQQDEFYWLGYWHKGYVIQSTFTDEQGNLYVSLVHSQRGTR